MKFYAYTASFYGHYRRAKQCEMQTVIFYENHKLPKITCSLSSFAILRVSDSAYVWPHRSMVLSSLRQVPSQGCVSESLWRPWQGARKRAIGNPRTWSQSLQMHFALYGSTRGIAPNLQGDSGQDTFFSKH